MKYRMYDLIEKKKHGGELTEDEIRSMITDYTAGQLPDYQMAALLMAIWFKGMTDRETTWLTLAMAQSGEQLNLKMVKGIKLDKHSTGGVGDKTSMILGPVLAALKVPTAKMSGRGLGFTGGTVDKLESIPGFRSDLTMDEFLQVLENVGFVDVAQTAELAPADKLLYSLRDVTATVDCIPLIASSIMSKKLAAGADRIVLDVKCGSGAFMQDPEKARALAAQMIRIGRLAGRETVAVISDMNQPLGTAVGNIIEVEEALEVLSGGGEERLHRLIIDLAVEMLQLSDQARATREEAAAAVEQVLTDGSAKDRFYRFVEACGGDTRFLDHPVRTCAYEQPVYPEQEGYLYSCNTAEVGLTSVMLGAGRNKKGDPIDYSAGIRILAGLGERVSPEKPIAVLYSNHWEVMPAARERLLNAYTISEEKPEVPPVIHEILRH